MFCLASLALSDVDERRNTVAPIPHMLNNPNNLTSVDSCEYDRGLCLDFSHCYLPGDNTIVTPYSAKRVAMTVSQAVPPKMMASDATTIPTPMARAWTPEDTL